MKMVSKRSLKKKIFTVAGILATCMLCVGIGIAMFTKADAADRIPKEVIVGRYKYTKENPLEVLEIVPHVAYDELGIMTGDDQGTYKWNDIVSAADKGKENAEKMKTYLKTVIEPYGAYCNAVMTGEHKLCYKSLYNGRIFEDAEDVADYLNEINYDFTNYKPILCTTETEDAFYYNEVAAVTDISAEWANIVSKAPNGEANASDLQTYITSTAREYVESLQKLMASGYTYYFKCTKPGESNGSDMYSSVYNFSWNMAVYGYDMNNIQLVLCKDNIEVEGALTALSDWNTIVAAAPTGAENADKLIEYITSTVNPYCSFQKDMLLYGPNDWDTKYVLGFVDNNGNVYENTGIFDVDLKAIDYNLNNLKIAYFTRNNYVRHKPLDESLNIRNYFAYLIFGNFDMEDKIKITPKVARDVTIEDIDRAGLIYISSISHNNSILDIYNGINGTKLQASSISGWELGGMDLLPEVALHLHMKSVVDRKALMFNSVDKKATNNVYSNIARLTLLQSGIDADIFISDFAYETIDKDDSDGIDESQGYEGLYGKFVIGTENVNGNNVRAIQLQLDVDTYYDDMGRKKETDKTVGFRTIPFQEDMFANDSVITTEYGTFGYAPNGNAVYYYPVYNAGNNQDFLTKSTFIFNSDNSMTNTFGSDDAFQSDYDENGNYKGSSYGDALFKLDLLEDELETPGVIRYILGAFGSNPQIIPDIDGDGYADIKVLEIEPAGSYRYSDTNYYDKELVCKWFGYYIDNLYIVDEGNKADPEGKVKVDVTIDHMSMNAFNGYNGDIRAEYDLVILGAYDAVTYTYKDEKGKEHTVTVDDNIVNNGSDSRYNKESGYVTDDAIYNNDLTDKAYNKILDYLRADMPMVIESDIYNRQIVAAARNTNVYKLNSWNLVDKVGGEVNIIPADTDKVSKDQIATRAVKFIVKPSVGARPYIRYDDSDREIKDYNWEGFSASDLVSKDDLARVVFKGTVSNVEEFRMKIYVDRDCDSIFNEQFDTDESELVYFATGIDGGTNIDKNNPDKVYGALCSEERQFKLAENGIDVLPLTGEIPNVSVVDTGATYVTGVTYDDDGKLLSMVIGDKVKYTVNKRDKETGRVTAWDVEIQLALPKALNGYMGWKVEVIDDNTGRVNTNTGAFAIRNEDTTKTVKVLQIIHDDGTTYNHIELGKDSVFDKAFQQTNKVTGLNLDVDTITKAKFNNEIKTNKAYLDDYSMLVLGLSDNYGVSETGGNAWKNFSAESIEVIHDYIDNGNSVLFTHDSLSYKNDSGATYSGLNAFTAEFQTVIGMQEGYTLTDPLHMKMDKLDGNKYSLFSSVEASTSTRNTTRVKKLNQGEITQYPFSVYDSKLESSESITVAQTHAQYFKLNLEDLTKFVTGDDGEVNEVDADDVVVWYTLDEDPNIAISDYFTATGQDAINNYYVYSVGNITYSSAGHSTLDTDQAKLDIQKGIVSPEMQLFVNTFVRAILSGNSAPEVEYENATKENSKLYSQFYRGKYFPDGVPAGFTAYDTINTQFTYKITDPDMALSAGRIAEAFLFYDANRNNEYDAGERLCYIGYDSDNKKPTYSIDKPKDKSVPNGTAYTANLWEIVTKVDVPDDTKEAMLADLVKNDLQIGIAAKDSRNAQGYSVLKIIQRDLHYLD